jgi:hypothetical protein
MTVIHTELDCLLWESTYAGWQIQSRFANLVEKEIRGNLHQQVADKENADAGLCFGISNERFLRARAPWNNNNNNSTNSSSSSRRHTLN